jgi:hypothetical protein
MEAGSEIINIDYGGACVCTDVVADPLSIHMVAI